MFFKTKKGIWVGLLSLLVFVAGYKIGASGLGLSLFSNKVILTRNVPVGKGVNFDLFWTVWDRVHDLYVDPSLLDPVKMVYGGISGMVAAVGDPYTVFLPPKDNKAAKDDLGGSFEGVGLQLGYSKDNQLIVATPVDGSPASKAGVKAGDRILNIKDTRANVDRDTNGLSIPEAVELIRGPRGTVVTLKLAREGVDAPFNVDLRRDTIVVKSVELKVRDVEVRGRKTKVAIIVLNKFGGRTSDEWTGVVDKIKELETKGEQVQIVLDLRNNPGGYLEESVWIASEFIKSGVIVKQEGRKEVETKTFEVVRQGRLLNEPLIVVTNGGSASAAEILAGALRDNGRARIVGEKTFGKGTVQQPEDLPGGAGIRITVARWLLPSGKWIDKAGVLPDVEVKNDEDPVVDEQLEKAVELLTS